MVKSLKMLILLVIIIPFMKVDAYGYCPSKDAIRYQKLASNIGYNYDYVESQNEVVFSIKLYNIHKELFVKDVINNKIYYPDKNKDLSEINISNLKDGVSYSFQIYTLLNNCEDRNFYTLYVTLPKYNKFYKYEECNDIKEFQYCQKWTNINISETQFKDEITKYKESLNSKEEEEIKDIIEVSSILDFILKYNYYFIGILVVILVILEIIYIKKQKKFNF